MNFRMTMQRQAEGGVLAQRPQRLTMPPYASSLVVKLQTAWKWVDEKYAKQRVVKRLKVAETVSLGEKRFVSILRVDGAEYLIGTSAGSVSLLASLTPLAAHTPETMADQSMEFADVLSMQTRAAAGGS